MLSVTTKSGIYNGYKVIGTQTLGLRGLVLWLKFNEGSGNIAYDSSFYNNHGTIYGAIRTDGKFGKALSFDGVDDNCIIPDSESLRFKKAISIVAWVKFLESTTNQIVTWREFLGKEGVCTFTSSKYNDYIIFFIDGADEERYLVNTSINWDIGKWTFIAATYSVEQEAIKVYKNAELIGTKAMNVDIEDSTGIDVQLFNVDFVKAIIDEVRIYNRALSENEIKMLYYNRIGAVPSKTI